MCRNYVYTIEAINHKKKKKRIFPAYVIENNDRKIMIVINMSTVVFSHAFTPADAQITGTIIYIFILQLSKWLTPIWF
jgi:hypothetical protein